MRSKMKIRKILQFLSSRFNANKKSVQKNNDVNLIYIFYALFRFLFGKMLTKI